MNMKINLEEHKRLAKFLKIPEYSFMLDKISYVILSNTDMENDEEWFPIEDNFILNNYEGQWFLYEVDEDENVLTENWIEIVMEEF